MRARAVVTYRADQFLSLPPLVQALVVTGLTVFLVVGWGIAVHLAFPSDPDLPEARDGLWWSVTHFMDGGTMSNSPADRRGFALGATICGVLVMSFVTGAFASKMGERIAELRSGKSPVVEKCHVLVLGFDSKVAFLAREVARSRERVVMVVMAADDREKIELALRPARKLHQGRARFFARTGDPRSEIALLRVSADQTRSIIIVPPADLDDEETVSWALSTLLAVRRVVGPDYTGHIVVEARRRSAEAVLRLAAEPGVAGPGALPMEVVASDDVIARVLAQSARQEGVYFALREMLSFVGSEIYLERVGHRLEGKTFDEAHEKLRGGIAVGVLRASGETILAPDRNDTTKLSKGDRLAVLAPRAGGYHHDGSFKELEEPPDSAHADSTEPERVLLLGFNRTLPLLIEELDNILPESSVVTVMCCPIKNPVLSLLEGLEKKVKHLELRHEDKRPLDLVSAADERLLSMDAVVILGCEDEGDDNGDANSLSTLLWLRHGMRQAKREVRRVVTEVRDLRSASYVRAEARDFLVSSDVVAMVLAQSALAPDVAPFYRELLSPLGHEIFLRPRSLYVGDRNATFGEVMAAARLRNEVAIGYYPASAHDDERSLREVTEEGELGDEDRSPVRLNPPRKARIPAGPAGQVVVISSPMR